MKRFPLRCVILVVWLGVVGWFVRFEAFPGWFTGALEGYRSLLGDGEVFSDQWMVVQFKGRTIGYNHSQVEMDERHPAARYVISSKTVMELDLGGERQSVRVGSVSRLDAFQRLMSFGFSLQARRYSMEVKGSRREGDRFQVVVASGASSVSVSVRIPDDVVIYSPMTMMALGRLEPGAVVKLRTFDPMSLNGSGVAVEDVLVRAKGRRWFEWGTNRTEVTELAVTYNEMEMSALVDSEGRVVREDTPFGWAMVASSAEEALKGDVGDGGGRIDLLSELGVPVVGVVRDVESCKVLKLALHGLHFPISDVAGSRLGVERGSNGVTVVELRARSSGSEPLEAGVREAALASSAYIQAGAPEIRAKAEEITRGISDPHEQALAIKRWVYSSVKKSMTVSIPSALDVLKQREGDCNEHTYLYVALARAVGIPAQVRVGIVYKDGRCFYHAWPAVHVGRWVEMDPTLNYDEVGVRHITLLQGELSSQAKLMSAIGQLRVEVLEQTY